MYNRKFDIKRDFAHLNELENRIIPIIRGTELIQRLMLGGYLIINMNNKRYENNSIKFRTIFNQ